MDDIAAKLSELLNSPEGREQMKTLADTFMGGGEAKETSPDGGASFNMPDIDVGTIMKLSSMFSGAGDDSRSKLLLSLKPHISEERHERVDQAVKILKLIALWPVISESGILKGLL